MRKKILRLGGAAGLWALGLLVLLPVAFLAAGSLMQSGELTRRVGAVVTQEGFATPLLLPEVVTVRSYIRLLVDAPEYLQMFWNSCALVLPALALQIGIGTMAGWAFARYRFPLRRGLYLIYVALMLLPFQVTMVPTYMVLRDMGLLGTRAGVILTQAFSTFSVFLLFRFFRGIPASLIEAASVDGAGEILVFVRIALPMAAPGTMALLVLGYIELWSMVEPPMLFLKDELLYPLSLYQIRMTVSRMGVAFAGSIITLLPPLLLFLFGQSYLEQGIQTMGLKE